MINTNITDKGIIKAFLDVSRNGVPKRRSGRRYLAKLNGMTAPPKVIVSLAGKQDYSEFNTVEAQNFLRNRGVEIIDTKKKGSH